MFIIILFIFGICIKKNKSIQKAIGEFLLKIYPCDINLSPNIKKKINIGTLGQVYEEEIIHYLESSLYHYMLGLTILTSWCVHVGFRDLYFIVFISILISLKPYLTVKNKYRVNVQILDRRLPLILSQMILLIGAGMTTVKALEKVTQNKEDILTIQLYKVTQEVRLGGSFERRIMVFMSQCQHVYMTRFGRILLSHEKNGTDASRRLLQELVEDLWKCRRSNALKKGEEASTQLLLPMSIALIGTVIMITVPAIYEIFTLT